MDSGTLGIVIGIVGILLGVAASYYFYRKGTRTKKPAWAARSFNLIRDFASELQDVEVLFRNVPVANLTVTKIMFWNDGHETINGTDLVPANPLRVVPASGVRLLAAEVLASNRPSTAVSVDLAPAGEEAKIVFEYLDHNNGVVIQIIHDGVSSDDISLEGDIKGVGEISHRAASSTWVRPIRSIARILSFVRSRPVGIALPVIYLFFAGYLLLIQLSGSAPPTTSPGFRIASATLFILFALIMAFSYVATQRPWIAPPPGLETFYDWPTAGPEQSGAQGP